MMDEIRANARVVLSRCDATNMREICDVLLDLAEFRLRGFDTVHVMGPPSGDYSTDDIYAVAQRIVRLNVEHHISVGTGSERVHLSVINEGSWGGESLHVSNVEQAYDETSKIQGERIAVMVTGSREIDMSVLARRLEEI